MLLKTVRLSEAKKTRPYFQDTGEIYQIDYFAEGRIVSAISRRLVQEKLDHPHYNRIDLVLSPLLRESDIAHAAGVLPKSILVNYGMNPTLMNSGASKEKARRIAKAVFDSVRLVCNDSIVSQGIVATVEREFEGCYDSERIEIACKSKETRQYQVCVSLIIPWRSSQEFVGAVTYNSLTNAKLEKRIEFPLLGDDDIYALAGKIEVSNGHIIISPRPSAIADVYIASYETPMYFEIEKMPDVSPTEHME